jgi:hypothetical protein
MQDQKQFLVGIDEAGRGPIAGPVAVGVAVVPIDFNFAVFAGVKDSKKLSAKAREVWIEKMKKEFEPLLTEDYENGKSVSNQKKVFPRKNYKLEEFSSTILIPDQYMDFFRKKIYEHKGVRAYIAYLLYKYRLHIANGIVPSYSSVTTKYQKKGQDLHKISFRPRVSDWVELKLYRVSFGMSISAFLMFLVIADYMDFARVVSYFLVAVGINTTPDLDLIAKVYLFRKKGYHSSVFQYREDKTG